MTSAELAREVFALVSSELPRIAPDAQGEIARRTQIAIERLRAAVKLIEAVDDQSAQTCELRRHLLSALTEMESMRELDDRANH